MKLSKISRPPPPLKILHNIWMVPKWIAVSKNDQIILGILESIQEENGQQAKSEKERTKLLKKLFSNMESKFAQVKSDHSKLLTISKIQEMRESSDYKGQSWSTHVWKTDLDQLRCPPNIYNSEQSL